MKKIDLTRIRIAQESYHMNRILDSCKTIEQIENTTNWINSIVEMWEDKISARSLHEYFNIHNQLILPITNGLTHKIKIMYNSIKKEENAPKKIVIKGYS